MGFAKVQMKSNSIWIKSCFIEYILHGDFVEYSTVSLLTTAIVIFIVYKFAGTIFDVHVKLKQLMLCACCAIFITLVIPRFFLSYDKIIWTMIVAIISSAIFAYYIAYYDQTHAKKD